MTPRELTSYVDFLSILVAIALPLGAVATLMCFSLLREIKKLHKHQPDGSYLRVEGSSLHGRVVFVEPRIDWERELLTWGMRADGENRYDVKSDVVTVSGYLIEGPPDVDLADLNERLETNLRERGALVSWANPR